jgi:hypothetical protein
VAISLICPRSRREQRRIAQLERSIDELDETIDILAKANDSRQLRRLFKLVRKRRAKMAEWNRLNWPRPYAQN